MKKYTGGEDFGAKQQRRCHPAWAEDVPTQEECVLRERAMMKSSRMLIEGAQRDRKGKLFLPGRITWSIFGSSVNFSECAVTFEPHNTSVR